MPLEPRRPSAVRTYGSKPRKPSSTHLWDGARDVPRRPALGDSTQKTTNEPAKANTNGISGFVKGVVDWLSPKKTRNKAPRKGSAQQNGPSRRARRISISHDSDASDDGNAFHDGDLTTASTASTADTLIASTPKKDTKVTPEPISGLDLLQQFCVKHNVLDFSEHITQKLATASISKLGEASFSEVFLLKHPDGQSSVLKIVPFNETLDENNSLISNLEDILQEIRISSALAKVDGFADFQGAVVVKGNYPEKLLVSWDEYASLKKSENERPSRFSDKQTFCIIELSYHGQDLESHSISTWTEAAHIFWSVVKALCRGEQECQFEHRDLHWGNVLIDQSEEDEILERLLDNLNLEDDGKNMLDGSWGEVKVTLIDYTLSRARVDDLAGSVAHYGFQDEAIFEGKRDYQFDIYRQMRTLLTDENGTNWEDYQPATNVLWLHYLANKLLYGKQLPTPVARLSARNQTKQAKRYGHERSFSVILEGEDKSAYEGLLNIYNRINPKHADPPESAQAVLALGQENAWLA